MNTKEMRIQTGFLAMLILLGSLSLPLVGCRERTVGEKIGDKIDDGLNRRPAEGIQDAVEDAKRD